MSKDEWEPDTDMRVLRSLVGRSWERESLAWLQPGIHVCTSSSRPGRSEVAGGGGGEGGRGEHGLTSEL